MFELPRIPDIAPIFGMDDVADIKAIPVGKCRRLVNARPGNPPKVRPGSIHRFIGDTDDYTLIPPAIVYQDDAGTDYIVCWILYNSEYLLVKIDPTTPSITTIGTAAGLTDPRFALLKAHNSIYCIISDESTTWDEVGYLVGNKIVEISSDSTVVRSMGITVSPQVLSVYLEAGGDWDAGTTNFIGYSWTFVRRTDTGAFTAIGDPQEISTFLPGAVEGPDNDEYSKTIEIAGTSQAIKINILNGISDRIRAVEEGATHLRVYKTQLQTDEDNANAATKYFMKDFPLLSNYTDLQDITLDQSTIKVTTTAAHGLADTDVIRLFGVLGTTELSGNDYTVEQQDGDSTFRLAGTDPSAFSKYESGGKVVEDAIDITNISAPDNTVTVTLSEVHSAGSDKFGKYVLEGVTGATQLNNVLLDYHSTVSDYILKFKNPGLEIDAYSASGTLYHFQAQTRHVMEVDLSSTYARVRVGRHRLFTGDYGETLVGQLMTFISMIDANGDDADDWNGKVATVTSVIEGEWGYGGGVRWTYGEGTLVELDILSSALQTVSRQASSGMRDIPSWYGYYSLGVSGDSGKTVSTISFDTTKATVTTDGAHAFSNDDIVSFDSVGGSVELNGNEYTVSEASGSTFKIPYGDASLISAYTSGGECGKVVEDVEDIFLCYPLIIAPNHGLTSGEYVVFLELLGTTELNDNTYEVEVVDEDSFYAVGPDSNDLTTYTGSGYLYAGGVVFEDDVTDAELVADPAAQLIAYDYTHAPQAKFAEFAKNRIWLFGIEDQSGRCNYSEYAGGESGTPTDLALAYPQKFSSWYKADYSFVCDSYGQEETGLVSIGDDLFFLFEEHIHALYGGDPTYSAAIPAAPDIGCVFPFTIVKANIDVSPFYGQCILFMSNKGPAYIKSGGEVGLFTDFAIKELWPDESQELFGDLVDHREYIIRNCTAGFWKDCWWVMYTNYDGTHRFFSYYFNPKQKDDDMAPHGPWVVEQAEV